jgi:Flp pilus assembly protein TadG
MLRTFSRIWRQERGAAAVEFAILAPLVLMILLAIADVANMLFMYNGMLNAARESARRVAAADESPGQGKSRAEAALAHHHGKKAKKVPYVVTVTVPNQGNPNGGNATVDITTPLSDMLILDLFRLFGDVNVRATVNMRMEA